ncbi:2708_t:CDS:2, partial [Rhizophagus irregularis]
DVTLINDSRKVEKYNIPDSYRDKSELARSIQAEKRATKKRKGKQTSSLSTIKNKKVILIIRKMTLSKLLNQTEIHVLINKKKLML